MTNRNLVYREPLPPRGGVADLHIRAVRSLMHSTHIDQVPLDQRKALSSLIGSAGFMLAPEMSQTILSCLETATDITGLMQNRTISGSSIKFMVDNEGRVGAGGDHMQKMTGAWLFGGPTRARKTKARIARAQTLMAAAREQAMSRCKIESSPLGRRATEAHRRRLAQLRAL